MKSLDSLMEECLPAGGVMVKGGRGLYMEVREKASGRNLSLRMGER